MIVWWLLLLCFSPATLSAESNCHESVLFHRGESILPSTDLFCVVRSNQEHPDGSVPIIQTEEEWHEFVSENPSLQDDEISRESSPPVLLVRKNGQVTEFLIPASFFGSKCTATHEVALGFSQSTTCTPEFSSFTEEECLSNEFLSAQSLFNSPLVSSLGNVSMDTIFRSNTSLTAVGWTNGQCQNVIEEVSIEIGLNETLVVEAGVSSIKYSTLTAQNHTDFMQRFIVNFKNMRELPEETTERGYQRGDEIYALKDEFGSPFLFSLPMAGVCEPSNGVPIKFLVNSTSTCTIRGSQCREMQQAVQQLVDKFIPNWVQSSPGEVALNETNALVIRRNRTEVQHFSGTVCPLSTDFLIIVYYAREGTEHNHRLVITSTTYAVNNEAVSLNNSAILRFSVQFKDSTPPNANEDDEIAEKLTLAISSRFAALPYIDLRLPNDFFYPFLERSGASSHMKFAVPILLYLLNSMSFILV